jgi:hypothetical protein
MNAVEIEEAISTLAGQAFDSVEFPFAFLRAFGNKETTIKRLRSGASNKSDLGGILQTNNIHIAACPKGEVTTTLAALRASPATLSGRGPSRLNVCANRSHNSSMTAAVLARLAVLLMVVWSYPFGRLQPCSANRYLAARKGSDQWALPNVTHPPARLLGSIKPSLCRPEHVRFIGS